MKEPNQTANGSVLSWDEVGLLCHGLSLSSRPIGIANQGITEEYSLGPRGVWILLVVASRYALHPLDLTKVFRVGRSLVTAELTRLTERQLISYKKSEQDGRRIELTLTPLGDKVARRAKEQLVALVLDRLSGYSRDELLLCSRMLRDFIGPQIDLFPIGAEKTR